MDTTIFSGFGINIIERNGNYFIRYDAGSIVTQFREDEINEVEAQKAQRSEKDAYEVILSCQLRAAGSS